MNPGGKLPLGVSLKNFQSLKVMIVDDSNTVRLMLSQILLSEKFDVIIEATNGREALNKLDWSSKLPDIICIDVEMPEMSGIELVGKLRPKYPDMKLIMITGVSDKDTVAELLKLGINGYIIKPLDRKVVLERLASILGRK